MAHQFDSQHERRRRIRELDEQGLTTVATGAEGAPVDELLSPTPEESEPPQPSAVASSELPGAGGALLAPHERVAPAPAGSVTAPAGERPAEDATLAEAVVSARKQAGRELARHRHAAKLSQQDLANRLGCTRAHVAGAESATNSTAAEFWRACDRVLGAGGALVLARGRIEAVQRARRDAAIRRDEAEREARLRQWRQDHGLSGVESRLQPRLHTAWVGTRSGQEGVTDEESESLDVERRELLKALGILIIDQALSPLVSTVEDPERLTKIAKGGNAARVDLKLLHDLQMVTTGFERLRHRVPGTVLLQPVEAQINMLNQLLGGSMWPQQRALLLADLSQTTSLLSWLQFFDQGNRAAGRTLLADSARAAEESRAPELCILALIRAAEQRTYDDRGAESVLLLDHAERLAVKARKKASPNALSWVCAAKAEAYSTLGQTASTRSLLDHAEAAREHDRSDGEPSWAEYWNRSRVASYAGASYMRLNRPADARAALTEALDGASVKHRSINLVDLAITHAQEGNPEPAVEFAGKALDIAGPMHYGTALERIGKLQGILVRWQTVACVNQFNERLAASASVSGARPDQ
jgi:transcriptional regulator with XRE-family HTH domain